MRGLVSLNQRSKLTFLKSRLLATFNCKMVAIKNHSVTKKKENLMGGGHFVTYYTSPKRGRHFMTEYTKG